MDVYDSLPIKTDDSKKTNTMFSYREDVGYTVSTSRSDTSGPNLAYIFACVGFENVNHKNLSNNQKNSPAAVGGFMFF